MVQDLSDSVVVHPLIVENMEVLIMPEVTRVLRMVFQVLSQPNYYLSKSGISSKRLSGPHLMKLKILGIVNNDVKVCSYISRKEALDIFKSFSSINNHHYLNRISWCKTIDIENETVDYVKSFLIQTSIAPELTYFIHEGRSMVPWIGFLKLLGCENVDSEKLTDEFIDNLKSSVILRVLENRSLYNYLIKINKIHHFGNDLKYVSMEEVMDALIKLGISVTSLPVTNERNKIRLLPPIYLDQNILETTENISLSSQDISAKSESNPAPLPAHVLTAAGLNIIRHGNIQTDDNNVEIFPRSSTFYGSESMQTESNSKKQQHSKQQPETTVFVYEVNGEQVIALPDIHKIIRKAQNLLTSHSGAKSAQQRQVNYYLTKMRCKKGRFTFMQLKTIRKVGTPLGNATYCTFIEKEDAINLFKIYASLNMENPGVFKSIVFSEPISLGVENMMEINDISNMPNGQGQGHEIITTDSLVDNEFNNQFSSHNFKRDFSTSDKNLLHFDADKDLFRKYDMTKNRLRQVESHMAVIIKYYKWKMRKITKANRHLKVKWRYLCQLLDSMEDNSFETNSDDGIISQNGSSQNELS